MLRALAAGLALWMTPLAVAQNFQFMPFVGRAQQSMLPHTNYAGIASGGDLDGDGDTDLLVPFSTHAGGSGGWGLYRRTPSGWDQNFVSAPDGRAVLVDFEGDRDLDLVFVPPHLPLQRQVQFFENRGGAMVPILVWSLFGVSFSSAAVGDVDGDGTADLVLVAPQFAPTPWIVLARGVPGPQPAWTLDTTAIPAGTWTWPELLDADGDGDLDLLATGPTSGLNLLLNFGGTFVDATPTLPSGIGTGHDFLVSGDFDGDGHADCAATRGDAIDVLWGGAGGFTYAPAVATVTGLRHVWPADFDGDGDLDFLAQQDFELDVLTNTGFRWFIHTEVLAQATSMRGVADVDADGKDDVLFALPYEGARCLYQARLEEAAFVVGLQSYSSVLALTAPAIGDVDGDGRSDIVNAAPGAIFVDRSLGGGAYARSTSTPGSIGTGVPWRSELADMDGDGDPDLVLKTDSSMTVAANNLGVFATAVTAVSAAAGVMKDDLRLGDVDGDGDQDVVVAESRGIVLFSNLGNGAFAPTAVVPNAAPCVELADIDSDGDLDLLCDVYASGHTLVVATNNGQGAFTPGPAFAIQLGAAPISLRASDVDGDGRTDLALLDGSTSRPRVYRNTGSAFVDRTPFDLPPSLRSCTSNLAVADLDDDGDLDLAAVASGTPQLQLLLNDGSGRFVDESALRVQPIPEAAGSMTLRATDFDDDGDVDLLVSDPNPIVISNHLRQCRSTGVPRLGGIAEVRLMSGPGFGAPGLGLLGVGFALSSPPLLVPGLAGRLQLDASTLQVLGAVTTSPTGVSSVFVTVPPDPVLSGLQLWFQGLIAPGTGQPGFTNAVYEVVLG